MSRLEGGRGLATPLLVVIKLNMAVRHLLKTYDPDVLSPEAKQVLSQADPNLPTEGGVTRFAEYALANDQGVEDLVQLYRGLPERQRNKLLAVVRATATALSPAEPEVAEHVSGSRRAC